MKALAFAAVACASLLILGAASAAPVQDVKVEISDKGFSPEKIEVMAGQKVIWMNMSKHEHTVTARAAALPGQDGKDKGKPLFDSGPIKPGAMFERVFAVPGTYPYACTIDKAMTGTVVVREKP